MRDFLNFEMFQSGATLTHTIWTIQHRTRKDILYEFSIPNRGLSFPNLFKEVVKKFAAKYISKSRRPMTAAQKNYYDKLVEFFKAEGRAPSYDEQCIFLNVSSKGTPHYYAKKLEESGWVWIDQQMVIPFDIAEPDVEEDANVR